MALAIVGALAGAATSAVGAISQGDRTKQMEGYNAKVAENNAGASAMQSKLNAQQIAIQTNRQVGMQRAAMSASGFDANTGTFSDVTTDTKQRGELSRLSTIYSGRLQSNTQSSQANLDIFAGQNAQSAGEIGAGSSILGGINQGIGIYENPSFQN